MAQGAADLNSLQYCGKRSPGNVCERVAVSHKGPGSSQPVSRACWRWVWRDSGAERLPRLHVMDALRVHIHDSREAIYKGMSMMKA